ncbi:hypothetical protein ACFFWE_21615 [Sphaerisporangium melleum]|uniref:hypothetical protein n=1 Tax=Sphaerisporangium melleum TaxID=321316 RepID=UPI001663132A|nr:hypothetical protein [Sphaerisporangium melleum]
MKLMSMTPAMPWLAFPCADGMHDTTAAGLGVARHAAAIAMPALGLTADGPAKLRQEKSVRVQADAAVIAYGATAQVAGYAAAFRRPADDATPSTANGGVQGPPPWRRPVIT